MAKIGFIGMGNMGTAIMRGLLKTYKPEELLFTSAHEAKMQKITEETGVAHVSTVTECASQVKYLVLAVKPQVLLMDEPTSALDPISTGRIEELALELKKEYTIIIVTHNMQQATRISDRTAFFLLGKLVEFDETERMFSTPSDKRTEDYITGRFG